MFIASTLRGIAAFARRRAAIRAIAHLDDHLLKDIGLRRGEIEAVLLHLDRRNAALR
ncbi:MAG: DUF1127 domain-containing protein [Aestuariivirga sp.]